MKTLQDIQKLSQQYKNTFNHTKKITNYFISTLFPIIVQSQTYNPINQFTPQLSDHHHIIHKTKVNLNNHFLRSINKQNQQQSTRQEKHLLQSINGISKIYSLNSQPNQTILTLSSSRIDPKVKRKLNQMNKGNFLHFLLIQKVGYVLHLSSQNAYYHLLYHILQTKDEKFFYDYLKKTFNFEIPYLKQELSIKINKKDIKYLFAINDNESQ
ncbi:unnamed protein product [Paramecium sonneborni]|uniref:Uncharacterized protein n=1 Tax=Paramecium sonneborni TaxID=65129 RepID=A0A8S1MZH5_9CILI|nr:unnamed protein product [Paramecium sonneborni]